MPYSPMHKHCIQMKDHKGKTTGLMMEGSAMHMSMLHKESTEQEKKDLMKDMPVDDKASAIEMSPYKMDHGSPAEFTGMSGGSALHNEDKKPKQTYKGGEFDPNVPVEGEVVVKGKKQGPSGEMVTKGGVKYRKIGDNLYPVG